MECDAARQLVNLTQADLAELDGLEREALEGHLEQCDDCSALQRWESEMALRMQAVPMPIRLRSNILEALQKQRKPWRKWVRRVSAAAAVFLLMFLLIWFWWLRPLPWVDTQEVIDMVNVQSMHTKTDVETAFREEFGVVMQAPGQFNYQNLTGYGLVQFKGRLVPQLEFYYRGGGRSAIAKVKVLSPKQFDTKKTWENRATGGSGAQSLHVLQGNRGFLFIVIYTGGRLEPFLKMPDI